MDILNEIRVKYAIIKNGANERFLRIWAATEAQSIGHGGVSIVSQATGIARSRITRGKKEILQGSILEKGRVGRKGAGRKSLEQITPEIVEKILSIADIGPIGNPGSPLRWTTKSLRKISGTLKLQGHKISHSKIGKILKREGFSLQSTRKRYGGKSHIDGDGQFAYINSMTDKFQKELEPVISVDAKKKELVGKFFNGGKEYHKKGNPVEVNAYGFLSLADGKAAPYGVYGIITNKAWASVGISKYTAQFAVSTIKSWWYQMGKIQCPRATKLLIHADGGGSNGSRNKLWKFELQKLSSEIGIEISVCHFPPGTSKWNKIEHRLFAQISKNWRGRSLETYSIIVNLIGATKTKTGLEVKADIDENIYETGIKVSKSDFEKINLYRHKFHGDDWNYTIKPL